MSVIATMKRSDVVLSHVDVLSQFIRTSATEQLTAAAAVDSSVITIAACIRRGRSKLAAAVARPLCDCGDAAQCHPVDRTARRIVCAVAILLV